VGNSVDMLARVKTIRESLVGPELRARVGAWWRGDMMEPGRRAAPPEGAAGTLMDADQIADTSIQLDAVTDSEALKIRIKVSEQLWGPGNLGPGDAEFVTELCGSLRLSKEKSVAFLGVGLGGAARAITNETEAWITGFDSNEAVAREGIEQNTFAGKAKKVTVTVCDYETLSLPKKKFNDVISKDELHLVHDKARLIKEIAETIKPGGTFLFTDFVAPGEPLTPEQLALLFSSQWGTPRPVSPGVYAKFVQDAGLDLRVNADITPRFAQMVTGGWANLRRLLDHMAGEETDPSRRALLLRVVAEEAGIWANRLEAFRDGRLALYRFVALKSG